MRTIKLSAILTLPVVQFTAGISIIVSQISKMSMRRPLICFELIIRCRYRFLFLAMPVVKGEAHRTVWLPFGTFPMLAFHFFNVKPKGTFF
jgi:hypothetical protein